MSASSAADVWAVGSYLTPEDRLNGLALHWDGSVWSFLRGVLPWGVFEDVVDVAPDDVWAVGYQGSKPGTTHLTPLIEHWDGTTWATATVQAPYDAHLNHIIEVPGGGLWTVGWDYDQTCEPLTEHLTPCP